MGRARSKTSVGAGGFDAVFGSVRGSPAAQAQRDRAEVVAAREAELSPLIAAANAVWSFSGPLDDLVRSLDNIGVAALTRYFSALDFDDEEFIETGYSRAAEIVRWFGGNARAGMPTALVVGRSQYHELLALQPLLEVFGSLIERLPAVWPPGGESALFCESAIELLREVIMPESLAGPLRSWIEALGVRYDSGRMSENEVKLLLEFIRQCERDDVEDLEFASLKRKEIAPLTARLLYGETSSASASATTPE